MSELVTRLPDLTLPAAVEPEHEKRRLFHALACRVAAHPILLLLTYRSDEVQPE